MESMKGQEEVGGGEEAWTREGEFAGWRGMKEDNWG
jgi:hypothetical protein